MKNFRSKFYDKIRIKVLKKYLYGTFGIDDSKLQKIEPSKISKKHFFNEAIKQNDLEKTYLDETDI